MVAFYLGLDPVLHMCSIFLFKNVDFIGHQKNKSLNRKQEINLREISAVKVW